MAVTEMKNTEADVGKLDSNGANQGLFALTDEDCWCQCSVRKEKMWLETGAMRRETLRLPRSFRPRAFTTRGQTTLAALTRPQTLHARGAATAPTQIPPQRPGGGAAITGAPPLSRPGRVRPARGACARAVRRRRGRGALARSGTGRAGPGTAALQGSPAAAAPASSASSSSSSSSPPQQQQLTLLVMQPGGGEEAAAGAAGVVLQPSADPQLPPSASGGLMVFYELGPPGEIEVGEEEVEAAGGESTASLEELEEEEAAAPGAAGGEAAAGGECKSCTYEGCSETTTQVVKQRKPWMCKRHRNKIYKDKYKRKKSDQALGGGGAAAAGGGPRAEDSAEGSVSVTKQRTGSIGDRPARPTLLEQVLNKKRLSLLRSPEVVQFLQKQQQLLSQQALEQRQQQFQGAPG
ncbi:regulatory factor X-associated protein [Melospiza georgiana]|uniref:regulatory factor X-associated protein n=1 Tax=Melospiza georgiana TaxID=44398 RepID=UPI0025AC6BAE|nr:regulatory factor X-associated protein [Melospiza georgiana]